MAQKTPLISEYTDVLSEIKKRVKAAQYEAFKAVNRELIALYWDIGGIIVARQQSADWGRSVVEQLAKDLQQEFPGVSGFSASNLWRMRNFYTSYTADKKLAPLVREIGWSHNVMIMERCQEPQQREYYIRMTAKFGWTKNVLALRIQDQAFEKTLRGQTNFDKTLPEPVKNQAKLAVRDEYTFDFLELGEAHSERELERALIARIEHFLREMGGMFAFMGSQYRLEIDGQEYFIDLLLYHRLLKCLVALELKVSGFKPEYVGKMQFYLAALDDRVRTPEENPSIGMILCREKKRTIVEYALKESNKPIGVAAYRIVRRLPVELKGKLPDPKQIERLLEAVELPMGKKDADRGKEE